MNNKGFTKVEILIVLGVIGVLGVIAGMAVSNARTQTRDAVRLSDVRQVQVGLELYFNDFSEYPKSFDLVPLGEASTVCLSEEGFSPSCAPSAEAVYMNMIGAVPQKGLKGLSACGNANNAYCYLGAEGEFRIQFELENSNNLLELNKGINCLTETGLRAGECLNISVEAPEPEVVDETGDGDSSLDELEASTEETEG